MAGESLSISVEAPRPSDPGTLAFSLQKAARIIVLTIFFPLHLRVSVAIDTPPSTSTWFCLSLIQILLILKFPQWTCMWMPPKISLHHKNVFLLLLVTSGSKHLPVYTSVTIPSASILRVTPKNCMNLFASLLFHLDATSKPVANYSQTWIIAHYYWHVPTCIERRLLTECFPWLAE